MSAQIAAPLGLILGSYKLPSPGYWEPDSGPMENQQALLTVKLAPQPHLPLRKCLTLTSELTYWLDWLSSENQVLLQLAFL